MVTERRRLYESSNGDSWFLVRHPDGHVAVRHEPNLSSGGQATEIDLASFLRRGPAGPEHAELIRLIGTLVSGSDGSSSTA